MNLAKPRVDIGLNTNNLEPMLAFWQNEACVKFDHVLPIRKGVKQHRHDALGSVVKINCHAEPLPDTKPSGYVELLIAREGLTAPKTMRDPDGNLVTLVPPGIFGIGQIGIRSRVRDLAAHRRFYAEGLGLTEEPAGKGAAFRAGETLLLLEQSPDAPSDAVMDGKGWRYITFQVFRVDEEHRRILSRGGREAMKPTTLGTTARISMVRDPDGNWIEISQRASITGSLEKDRPLWYKTGMALEPIATFELSRWTGPFDAGTRAAAQDALECGKVLYFPKLPFTIANSENSLLTDAVSNGKAKNISRDPDGRIQGDTASPEEGARLSAMMGRFAEQARGFVLDLFPGYAGSIEQARTSYRPVEIAGRSYSPRNDDKRLHVDAFPSRPQRGRRILRVFSNIHPVGGARLWHVGEPFEDVAKRYASKARKPLPLEPWLFDLLGITRGRRSEYDYLMLGLHDGAKLDSRYQAESPQVEFAFPAGTSWMCYTDQTMHAALSGQFALEQTFHLPVEALAHPERSPLKVLERMTGRTLV